MESTLKQYQETRDKNPDKSYLDLIRNESIESIGVDRQSRQLYNEIISPVGDYVELCYHFLWVADLIRDQYNGALRELGTLFDEGYRDLKVCLRNFDYIILKKFKEIYKDAESAPSAEEILDTLDHIYEKIDLEDEVYSEWWHDSIAKIGKFYSILRVMADQRADEFPVLESLIFFAIIGHKVEKQRILDMISHED
tara:strand:- start:83 stop:670 length:588 start_codon:yes stop_codon:yes gene_type:complete